MMEANGEHLKVLDGKKVSGSHTEAGTHDLSLRGKLRCRSWIGKEKIQKGTGKGWSRPCGDIYIVSITPLFTLS